MLNILKEYDDYIISSQTDTKGIITFVSSGFCKISGYSKEELLGKKHNIVRDPSNDSSIFKNLWEKLHNEETVIIEELSNRAKNGSIYYLKAKFFPVYQKNVLVGYRSLRTDITDKIRVEKMYQFAVQKNISHRELNEMLHHDLEKSKKELNLFKHDIISLFSHELKTPLNAILSFSEYISKSMEKELSQEKIKKIKQLADNICSNGNTQLDMINTMLRLVEIQSKTLEVKKEQINLYDMLSTAIDAHKNFSNKEIMIDIDKSIVLFADKTICHTIFINLYSNALKYAKNKILVHASKVDSQVVLSIEDDGAGIPKKKEESIFNMFANLEEDLLVKMDYQSLGIGLYTSKLLAYKCNKDIIVEKSALLGGAAFKIIEQGKTDEKNINSR